jgi:hypothetical protein
VAQLAREALSDTFESGTVLQLLLDGNTLPEEASGEDLCRIGRRVYPTWGDTHPIELVVVVVPHLTSGGALFLSTEV